MYLNNRAVLRVPHCFTLSHQTLTWKSISWQEPADMTSGAVFRAIIRIEPWGCQKPMCCVWQKAGCDSRDSYSCESCPSTCPAAKLSWEWSFPTNGKNSENVLQNGLVQMNCRGARTGRPVTHKGTAESSSRPYFPRKITQGSENYSYFQFRFILRPRLNLVLYRLVCMLLVAERQIPKQHPLQWYAQMELWPKKPKRANPVKEKTKQAEV